MSTTLVGGCRWRKVLTLQHHNSRYSSSEVALVARYAIQCARPRSGVIVKSSVPCGLERRAVLTSMVTTGGKGGGGEGGD